MQPDPVLCVERTTLAVKAALALLGLSAVTGQIVLMREFIVVFNGNEISLGILLASWLFWTAAGSSLSSGIGLGHNNARRGVAALECLLGASLPPTIWALRASKSLFQTVPGELVGPGPMFLTSLACFSLFCVVSGALFVVAARMFEQERAISARKAASSAYLLEAAGAGLGGILASVVLLRFLGPFQIATVVSLLNLWMAAVLLLRMSRKQLWAVTAAAALCATFLIVYGAPALERSAQARLWRGFRLVGSRDSIYGNLTVIETGNLRSIYDNGVILANAPDESAAEEAVHYALLEHPAPRRVLLIGGSANGSIAESLKHPTVERVDAVELDPALIGMAQQFFPAQYAPVASDPRVHMHSADGRYYVRASADTFDAILLNVPDPQTAQLNRFYTAEFFRSARDRLAPGGLLALELRSSEESVSPDLAEFLRCIHHTLKEVFPYVVAIPGDTIHFFAATRPDVLTDDPQTLIARLQARKLKTQFVREYFIPFRMMPDRMEQIGEQLRPLGSTPVNRDFKPIAYYFDVVLWSSQFKGSYSRWFRAVAHIDFTAVLSTTLFLLLLLAMYMAIVLKGERRARSSAAYCLAATGFTLMTLQIFLLLSFQSVFGYVYHQLRSCRLWAWRGLPWDAGWASRRIRSSKDQSCRALAATQFLLALSAPALMLL